jgi:hypothetical protein
MPVDVDTQIRRGVDRLSALTGIPFTFGYLGDVSGIPGTPAFRDSRSYYLFAAHPGRVGGSGDHIGGVSDPADLLPLLRGALALAAVQATPR